MALPSKVFEGQKFSSGVDSMKKGWLVFIAAIMALGSGTTWAQDNTLTAAEKIEGYSLMFDGTLKSFQALWGDYVQGDSSTPVLSASMWSVDASCACLKLNNVNTKDFRSVKKYKDFELRLTYRINGNQGVFYRCTVAYDKAWKSGVEYAINNVTNLGKDNPGAAYDLYAPNPITYNTYSTNKWNRLRIIVKGDSVEHWSDSVKVVGYKYHSKDFWAQYNVSKWTDPVNGGGTLTNLVKGTQDIGTGYITEGYLGLQGDHGGNWMIKDFKVTENPCFGPIKPDGSVCATTSALLKQDPKFRKVDFTARQAPGLLTVTFAKDDVKGAALVGLDGKVWDRATMSEAGRKAIFANQPRAGLYLLKLDMASGVSIQKLNIL